MLVFTGERLSAFDICDALELLSMRRVRPVIYMGRGVCAGGPGGRGRELTGELILDKFKVRAHVKGLCATARRCRPASSTCSCRRVSTKGVLMSARWIWLCTTTWRLVRVDTFDVSTCLQISATGPTQRMLQSAQEARAHVVVLCTRGREEQSWRSQSSWEPAENVRACG